MPNIILMDVQMPILDGYRATHLIRHHSPYSAVADIRTLPIVAMTASAIQGDKEKCKKAGMDDYLAKPVKGKTLESMLLKWAIKGNRKVRANDLTQHLTEHDSNCTDQSPSPINPTAPTLPTITDGPNSSILSSENNVASRVIADTANLPGIESEGDRGLQRVEAEEKATSLRDEKLLAASESDPYQHHSSHISSPLCGPMTRPGPPTAQLTEENVTRLDRGRDGDHANFSSFSPPPIPHDESTGEGDSLAVNSRDSSPPRSTVGSLHSPRKVAATQTGLAMRGKLARKESGWSQRTVTQADVGTAKGQEGGEEEGEREAKDMREMVDSDNDGTER